MTKKMDRSGWRPSDYVPPERKPRSDKGTRRGSNKKQVVVNLPSEHPRRDSELLRQYASDCGYTGVAALIYERCMAPALTWGDRKMVALSEFRKSLRDPITGLPPELAPISLVDPQRGDEQFDESRDSDPKRNSPSAPPSPAPVSEPSPFDIDLIEAREAEPVFSMPVLPYKPDEEEPTWTYDDGTPGSCDQDQNTSRSYNEKSKTREG